jgi:predicted RNA-binding Zn ribbon-like protein
VNAALGLVNSEWWRGRADGGVDKLHDPAWLAAYLEGAGFGELEPPSPARVRDLVRLRALLRRLVDALVEGAEPDADDLHELDEVLGRGRLRRRLTAAGLALEPASRDWSWGLSEIAASFAELVAYGDPTRLKVCANDECGWSFYDESRNRSRRWCGASSCGNAEKARRFRARRREQRLSAPAARD